MHLARPPPEAVSVPIVHKIIELYKNISTLARNMPKTARYGIYTKADSVCMNCLCLSLEAALENRIQKLHILTKLRIQIEMLKIIIRLLGELKYIKAGSYARLTESLCEISKMASGWIKYLDKKGA